LLREYASDPKNAEPWLRTYVKGATGDRYVANRVASASDMADGLEHSAAWLGWFGYGLLGIGALYDGISSGSRYYQDNKSQGVGAAVAVGINHAVLSTVVSVALADAGTDVGAAAGAAIGSAVLPVVGTAVGGLIGAAVGGAVGGYVGALIGDAVANDSDPIAATIGSWVGSLF
jgi:hypothetical protein